MHPLQTASPTHEPDGEIGKLSGKPVLGMGWPDAERVLRGSLRHVVTPDESVHSISGNKLFCRIARRHVLGSRGIGV
jgi:hypothetical protein